MGQFHDEVIGIGFLDCSLYLIHGDVLSAIANVFSDRGGKQHRFLTHHADDFPQVPHIDGPDVLAVDTDLKRSVWLSHFRTTESERWARVALLAARPLTTPSVGS